MLPANLYDPSGERLRDWLGVTRPQFYNPDLFAIIPWDFAFRTGCQGRRSAAAQGVRTSMAGAAFGADAAD